MLKEHLSQSEDMRKSLNEIRELLHDSDVRREWFKLLDNPNWIKPLNDAGYFNDPPSVKKIEGIGEQSPAWPESGYLARMAEQASTEVAEIFAKIKTDNISVIGDMLDAALAMPPTNAKSLVPSICQAANIGMFWLYFEKASDLCIRLAENDESDIALELAEALFTPKIEKGQKTPSRRDANWYKRELKKVTPVLAKCKPNEFLPKLCDWLKKSVEAKRDIDPNTGYDHSYSWRPAIEEHEQNRDYDFVGVMVGIVREGFEEAIKSDNLTLDDALRIIESCNYLIFKRLRIHLINEFAEQNLDLARKEVLLKELFDDDNYKHEYAMLVGRRFNLLSTPLQKKWFDWIGAGPDMSNYDETFQVWHDHPPTPQDRQNRINHWKFEKLHWVKSHLHGQWLQFYEEMLSKYGEPEMADLNVYVGPVRWGHDSPMNVEQLQNMTFEQAVKTVSSWQPEGSMHDGPSIEGLASTFGQYVATDPQSFSAQAKHLKKQPAIYVRKFISQMSDALKNDREINLPAMLDLCQWVVEQPVEEQTTPRQEDAMLIDRGWQWARDEVTQFIENICKAKRGDVQKYHIDNNREILWELIDRLCSDPSDSNIIRDISNEDPRIHDYLDLGINSPRGKAIETALEYARWVANHIKEFDGKQDIVPNGFDAMLEVREMLEQQISPENRHIEVMSIIGSRIGLIYWIDKEWLVKNAERIFKLHGIEEEPPVAQGWAAWNAFLMWVRPHIEYYRIFRPQYSYSVEQTANVDFSEDTYEQPMFRLGEHLMILYGRGQLGLDDDGGLLRQFLKTANSIIRRHTIGFVGQSIKDDEKLPDEVIERFKTLWDLYWSEPGKDDAAEKPDAWLYGSWFSCGHFPEQWSLDNLGKFVEVAPIPEPDHAVIENLAKIAHFDIHKSLRILDVMIRGDSEGWRIRSWEESAKTILKMALKTTGYTYEKSVSLIDYLGRRGYTDYGELLNIVTG
jgi:hypothetical protein